MATKNPEKRNLLKAHKVARDHLRRASYVLRAINAHLLDKLLGPKSSEDDNPLNEQRKEEEDYLNVFLNQEDFGAEVLNHFCNLISKVSNSDGGNTQEQDSGQMFQITDGSIQGDNGPNLVPNSSETQSSQNETSNKRRNEDKLELAGPSTKQQKISVPRENPNDETYNDSQNEADEIEFALPQTPQPPGGVTPRHTSLSSAEYTIATNDRVGTWVDNHNQSQ